jgi:hypothetical protein
LKLMLVLVEIDQDQFDFLMLQEFRLREQTRTSSISTARRSGPTSNLKTATSLSRLQH